MNQRQRRQQIRERRQACLANRRAGTRSPKPVPIVTWAGDRGESERGAMRVTMLARNVAQMPCCRSHARTLKRLARHLISAHGMSSDWTGWLDFEAEYMAAVLG